MNSNTYGSTYSIFHQCPISLVRDDIIVFDLGNSPFETWMVSRLYPAERIFVDSKKPLLSALKSFFKLDATASVICNSQYNWTAFLGNERVIYPVSREVKPETKLHLYATPYFVTNPQVVSQVLQATVRPAYENVYFYKNTVMYLDDQDLPYPGGRYFDEMEPSGHYRICFLSDESIDYVADLVEEWKFRRGVMHVPYMTRIVTASPKFIDFKPVSDFGFSDSNVMSTGIVQRRLSSKKPEHVIQDILNSYHRNVSRDDRRLLSLGLIVEWPLNLSFEHAKPSETQSGDRKFVALSVNGNNPHRVLYVLNPYDRYVEYDNVPATVWTPLSFEPTTLKTDVGVKKVTVDSVVIGLVYRNAFFCLSQPLLEGRPTRDLITNGEHILSEASAEDIKTDSRIQIYDSFRYDETHSLRRVGLKGVALETWCLTKADPMHHHPKGVRLPALVRQWVDFFTQVRPDAYDADVSIVRLALVLSKHNMCYNLVESDKPKDVVVSEKEIKFYANEKVVQFINEARIVKFGDEDGENESSFQCVIN